MSTKASKSAAKKPAPKKASKAAAKARATILGYSATSVIKWMGKQGWTTEQARSAIEKLATGGEVKSSTISTGLSDGRNPKYSASAATPTAAEVKQLKAAAK